MARVRLIHGDCLHKLKSMPDNSIDSIVTDPPYGLKLMGKKWDYDVPSVDIWRECLRVMKPGAHLLSFGGSRTYHRMACAIEDAGFEIRDQIMWVYSSGMPKSLDVSKAIDSCGGRPEDIRRMRMGDRYTPSGRGRINYDHGSGSAMNGVSGSYEPKSSAAIQWQGWGTSLKPAHEPVCVARKPLIGTVVENVLEHGTGALNISSCLVPITTVADDSQLRTMQRSRRTSGDGWGMSTIAGGPGQVVRSDGRWPANLIRDCSDEVLACFPDSNGQQGKSNDGQRSKANCYGEVSDNGKEYVPRGDTGSAARFFYCAKASRADREDGLDEDAARESGTNTVKMRRNTHPTVKPTDLMRYLCRLITPSGGTVLDPFMGSGSTGRGAVLEGFRFIGIEMDRYYVSVAAARIKAIIKVL